MDINCRYKFTMFKCSSIADSGAPVTFTIEAKTPMAVVVTVKNIDPSKQLTIRYTEKIDELNIVKSLGEFDVSTGEMFVEACLNFLIKLIWTYPHDLR